MTFCKRSETSNFSAFLIFTGLGQSFTLTQMCVASMFMTFHGLWCGLRSNASLKDHNKNLIFCLRFGVQDTFRFRLRGVAMDEAHIRVLS